MQCTELSAAITHLFMMDWQCESNKFRFWKAHYSKNADSLDEKPVEENSSWLHF